MHPDHPSEAQPIPVAETVLQRLRTHVEHVRQADGIAALLERVRADTHCLLRLSRETGRGRRDLDGLGGERLLRTLVTDALAHMPQEDARIVGDEPFPLGRYRLEPVFRGTHALREGTSVEDLLETDLVAVVKDTLLFMDATTSAQWRKRTTGIRDTRFKELAQYLRSPSRPSHSPADAVLIHVRFRDGEDAWEQVPGQQVEQGVYAVRIALKEPLLGTLRKGA